MRNALNPMQRLGIALIVLVSAIPIAAQNTYDARIIEYAGLRFACGPVATPSLKIRNVGSAAMGTCVVETWKNGLLVNSFNWVLAVPALEGETRQPSLPAILGIGEGDALEFRIISVNGEPDEDADGNILAVVLDAVPVDAETYLVQLTGNAGFAPDELSWAITAANGQVVAQGGPYAAQDVIDEWVELLPEQCYMVRFAEAGPAPSGDGLLSLIANGAEVVVLSPGTATDPSLAGLTTGLVQSLGQHATALEVVASPNPTHGEVRFVGIERGLRAIVAVRDGSGRLLIEGALRDGNTLNLGGQAAGLYMVELRTDGGRVRHILVVREP